ncbi:hypothetical protein HRD49_40855 [Corallococcus exiguus]|nr:MULTISPECIES: hypothetical protein [Corallococcus]NRD68098.1 hypothetical protein [Corallococcus exiguus]RKH16987.1 hypothetical protein D7V77_36460 [Corallococcus sp. CA041A]RUO87400.1 hypothetical protein D7Y11_40850 [Corallococcus sp. AB018]
MTCSECSGELAWVGVTRGTDHFRCLRCGHDVHALSTPRLGPGQRFRAVIRWKNEILSFAELESLRKIAPEARAIPAVDIWERSKRDGWVLGEYMESQIDALWNQAHELQLRLDLVLVSECEPEVRPVCMVVVWKTTSPSLEEIVALRKLSEEAANMPVSAVLKKAREGEWLLGRFWPNRLPEIERRAMELGLQLRRES